MEYSCETVIDLPRDKVVALMDNQKNLKKWQRSLQELEHLSGEPGHEGAKCRQVHKMGNRVVEMVETIVRRDLPRHFDATYEATARPIGA